MIYTVKGMTLNWVPTVKHFGILLISTKCENQDMHNNLENSTTKKQNNPLLPPRPPTLPVLLYCHEVSDGTS